MKNPRSYAVPNLMLCSFIDYPWNNWNKYVHGTMNGIIFSSSAVFPSSVDSAEFNRIFAGCLGSKCACTPLLNVHNDHMSEKATAIQLSANNDTWTVVGRHFLLSRVAALAAWGARNRPLRSYNTNNNDDVSMLINGEEVFLIAHTRTRTYSHKQKQMQRE